MFYCSTMKFLLFSLILCTAALAAPSPKGPIIWQEEFDSLDTTRWKHLITAWRGGNNEFQYYTDRGENRYTDKNILQIR